jgi:hypothetical protein
VIGEHETHALRQPCGIVDVQKLIRAVRVGVRPQHAGNEELCVRKPLAQRAERGTNRP